VSDIPLDGDYVEMPPMELPELIRFLDAMPRNETCCGASLLPCGHYLSFIRVDGQTMFLGHHSAADAIAVGEAASALVDLLDAIYTREHGGVTVDIRALIRDVMLIGRDEPSTDD